jgi:GNT-I family
MVVALLPGGGSRRVATTARLRPTTGGGLRKGGGIGAFRHHAGFERRALYGLVVVAFGWVIGFVGVFFWHLHADKTTNRDAPNDATAVVALPAILHPVAASASAATNLVGDAPGAPAAVKAPGYGISPLLIFTCRRDRYLSETLDHVYRSIGPRCRFGCPIIVSEDGRHKDVERVVVEHRSKFEDVGIPLVHIHHDQRQQQQLRGVGQQNAYQALARHYGWALAQVFDGKADPTTTSGGGDNDRMHPTVIPRRVVILEEDIRVAPDFFPYMEAAAELLDTDPTLFAVSTFNDNGHQVRGGDPKRLLRSDFFPGLGWMMTRELWKTELQFKWPNGCTSCVSFPLSRPIPFTVFDGVLRMFRNPCFALSSSFKSTPTDTYTTPPFLVSTFLNMIYIR